MRRRGWAAVRTDSAIDVLTVWFAYVTPLITEIASAHGLCKQFDGFTLVTVLQYCGRLFCARHQLPSSILFLELSSDFLPSLFPSPLR